MSDMVETLAFAGELPWHGKGNQLAGRVSASDMLVAAGLDWTVEAQPAFVSAAGSEYAAIPGYKALVRRPHGNVLKVVSDEYGIIQNQELATLAEAMAGEGMESWEVGGSLEEGRKVFFCGVVGETKIAGDSIRQYLTLASSHDCSFSMVAAKTGVRVVCANTLGTFLAEAHGRAAKARISIRHTKNASEKVKLATALVQDARAYFGAFNEEAIKLVGQAMTAFEAAELARELFPAYRSEDTGALVVPELQAVTLKLFEHQPFVSHDRHIAKTRWGFFQALTAALDHNRRGSESSKLRRFLCGTDDSIRSRAWRRLLGR